MEAAQIWCYLIDSSAKSCSFSARVRWSESKRMTSLWYSFILRSYSLQNLRNYLCNLMDSCLSRSSSPQKLLTSILPRPTSTVAFTSSYYRLSMSTMLPAYLPSISCCSPFNSLRVLSMICISRLRQMNFLDSSSRHLSQMMSPWSCSGIIKWFIGVSQRRQGTWATSSRSIEVLLLLITRKIALDDSHSHHYADSYVMMVLQVEFIVDFPNRKQYITYPQERCWTQRPKKRQQSATWATPPPTRQPNSKIIKAAPSIPTSQATQATSPQQNPRTSTRRPTARSPKTAIRATTTRVSNYPMM